MTYLTKITGRKSLSKTRNNHSHVQTMRDWTKSEKQEETGLKKQQNNVSLPRTN